MILGEQLSVWGAQHHAKMRAVFLIVLWAPSPLLSVLWGVHPSLPPGLLHSLPRRWTLARARGTHHQPRPHHGYCHLPPPEAGPGECAEERPLEQARWVSGPATAWPEMSAKCSLSHRRLQSPVALKPANAGSLHMHKKLTQGSFVFTDPSTNLILSERSQCQGPPADRAYGTKEMIVVPV